MKKIKKRVVPIFKKPDNYRPIVKSQAQERRRREQERRLREQEKMLREQFKILISKRNNGVRRTRIPGPKKIWIIHILYMTLIVKFVNCFMEKGKKELAIGMINKVLRIISEDLKVDPFYILLLCLKKISPRIKLKRKRIAGKNQIIPVFLPVYIQYSYGIRLLVWAARQRKGTGLDVTIMSALYSEILDIVFKRSTSVALKRIKEDRIRALENKYFVKYL